MINGNLQDFLDSGWYTESTLYYNGFIYWFEASTNPESNITHFFVDRWKATTTDNILYNEYHKNGKIIEYATVYDRYSKDMNILKKEFLEAPVFDGKNFWQIENDIAWLEEGEPIDI